MALQQDGTATAPEKGVRSVDQATPMPQPRGNSGARSGISVRAFLETPGVSAAVQSAFTDRRLARVNTDLSLGGIEAAIECFRSRPTPDVLLLESGAPPDALLAQLTGLAAVCDAQTKVLLIGISNDISLYRQLIADGITDYFVSPVETTTILDALDKLAMQQGEAQQGKIYAFIGAKGGVGSSTIAQNVSWTISESCGETVMLADMDFQCGTASLNFNVETDNGFADYLVDPDRMDLGLLERLLIKRGHHLSLLPGATQPYGMAESDQAAIEKILSLARQNFDFVVIDVPRLCSVATRSMLIEADEIFITAVPDLASLKNTKSLIEMLRQARPNDALPRLVLNQVGMAKRQEIKPLEFAKALDIELLSQVPFEPALFSAAASNGQMLSEISDKPQSVRAFKQIAQVITQKPLQRRRTIDRLKFWMR